LLNYKACTNQKQDQRKRNYSFLTLYEGMDGQPCALASVAANVHPFHSSELSKSTSVRDS
jgi:hypothetical protein